MTLLLRSLFAVGFILLFYSANLKTENVFKKHKKSASSPQQKEVVDTAQFILADDYSITNEMLEDKNSSSSLNSLKSGNVYSLEKVWFTNSQLKETIVMELYTDYHRMITFHFLNNDIPENLIDLMEFHILEKNAYEVLQDRKEKTKALRDFISQSNLIDTKYFTSNQGIKLGDYKAKIIGKYGESDSTLTQNGFEIYYWTFKGDIVAPKSDKKLAYDSYGHSIIAYFKNGKLAARIIKNDIP